MPSLKICRYCGERFTAKSCARLYCCDRCRRAFQDRARKIRRAEGRGERHRLHKPLPDPWLRQGLENLSEEETAVLGGLDPYPAGVEFFE